MFDVHRLKVQLNLAARRLKMLQSKKEAQSAKARREIATLLQKNKENSARIQVERIIREDFLAEAMELLEVYCDTLLARILLIKEQSECEEGIKTQVVSLIWAAPRLGDETKELLAVRDLLVAKYGKVFMTAALEDTEEIVDKEIKRRLQFSMLDPKMVENYLVEIAKAYSVPWRSSNSASDSPEQDETDGSSDEGGGARELAVPSSPLLAESTLPQPVSSIQLPSIPSLPASNKKDSGAASRQDLSDIPIMPSVTRKNESKSPPLNDCEDLKRRLDALRR